MPVEIKNLSIKIKVDNNQLASKKVSEKEESVTKNELVAVVEKFDDAKKER